MNDQTKTDEPTETGTALVERRPILAGGSIKAIIPQSFGDICRLAAVIAESGLAPKDFKTPQAISIAIMHGMAIGLPPMQALQPMPPLPRCPMASSPTSAMLRTINWPRFPTRF